VSAFFLALVLLSGFLPACYVAASLPSLWLLQNTFLGSHATLLSAGGVDVTLIDGVIVILLGKVLYSLIVGREVVLDRPLYLAFGAFFGVNILATVAAGVKFGGAPLLHGFVALARLSTEIAIVPILAQSITTMHQAKRCAGIILGTLIVLGVIQFFNFFGARYGVTIGEVQGIERGELRYFGPVGDSIGFVLLLGYVAALCFARPAGVLLFAGGIVLTAGIGAIFGTAVATALYFLFGIDAGKLRTFFRRYLWLLPVLAFAGLVAGATVALPMAKTLLDRLQSGHFHESGQQRLASTRMAKTMFLSNPLSGVGFMGYPLALERYGGARYFDLAKIDGGSANANNQLLQSLTDSGVFGLLALVGIIVSAGRLFLKISARCENALLRIFFRASFVWLLAQVFGNLAAVWLVPSSYVARFLWVLLGIAVAAGRLLPRPEASLFREEGRKELAPA
jgi:hypothetical protein